jgi:hypothetical protein
MSDDNCVDAEDNDEMNDEQIEASNVNKRNENYQIATMFIAELVEKM